MDAIVCDNLAPMALVFNLRAAARKLKTDRF